MRRYKSGSADLEEVWREKAINALYGRNPSIVMDEDVKSNGFARFALCSCCEKLVISAFAEFLNSR